MRNLIGPSRRTRVGAALLLLTAAIGGCGEKTKQASARDTMTERQKDSVLGASKIPGAQAVQKAMKAADSSSAQVRALDSIHP